MVTKTVKRDLNISLEKGECSPPLVSALVSVPHFRDSSTIYSELKPQQRITQEIVVNKLIESGENASNKKNRSYKIKSIQ